MTRGAQHKGPSVRLYCSTRCVAGALPGSVAKVLKKLKGMLLLLLLLS